MKKQNLIGTKLLLVVVIFLALSVCIGILAFKVFGTSSPSSPSSIPEISKSSNSNPNPGLPSELLNLTVEPNFEYPVGAPDASGYHNLQAFGANRHLGEDWNNLGPCNDDLGDNIYSIGVGYVSEAQDFGGGWGKVVRIIHKIEDGEYIESLYAHLDEIYTAEGDTVEKGEIIGTMGNADGLYCAHLHFEIRDQPNLPLGGGYSDDRSGYINPTDFIESR